MNERDAKTANSDLGDHRRVDWAEGKRSGEDGQIILTKLRCADGRFKTNSLSFFDICFALAPVPYITR